MEVAAIVALVGISIVIGVAIYRRRTARSTDSQRSASISGFSASARSSTQSTLKTSRSPQSLSSAAAARPGGSSGSAKKFRGVAVNATDNAVGYFGTNPTNNSGNNSMPPRANANKKYLAVGVRPQLHCCRAVMALENIRFLAEEAPHFPVPGCQFNSCRCQYIYFADRRDDERRTIFGAARSILPANLASDRRRRERRKNSG
jgi:hypothetical protein